MTNSPTDYERLIKDLLVARLTKESPGSKLRVVHNVHYKGKSGHDHQIDVAAEMKIAGVRILVLVECKHYSKPVGVDDVLEFATRRIEDVGAHKGILVTTSGFQRGAVKVARSKGIALVIACDLFWEICCESSMRELHLRDGFVKKAEGILQVKKNLTKGLSAVYRESAEAMRGERLLKFGTGDRLVEGDRKFRVSMEVMGAKAVPHGYIFVDDDVAIDDLAKNYDFDGPRFLAVRRDGRFSLIAVCIAD